MAVADIEAKTMVAQAIADERERCAKIADDVWEENDKLTKAPGWDSACLKIAAGIRQQ